jgi:DNA-binding transcriptional LysR family regulator
MRGADLSDLTAFAAVAEHLSFRAAAEQLGLTPSALSHRMRQLEERVGVRLLHRTTRSVALTDAGRRLQEQVSPAIERISGAVENLTRGREKPMGKLRIHTPPITGEMVLAPILREFLETYPDVELELGGPGPVTDIVGAGFDAGISFQEFVALDMTALRVVPNMRIAVVGSPSYFANRPIPRTPEDLLQHNCIRYRVPLGGTLMPWTFTQERTSRPLLAKTDQLPVTGNLIVGDVNLAIRAAVNGAGIAYTLQSATDFLVRAGHLVRVLEDWSPSLDGFYLYYPGNRQVPAALRALIDMIKSHSRSAPESAQDPLAEQVGPLMDLAQPSPAKPSAKPAATRRKAQQEIVHGSAG